MLIVLLPLLHLLNNYLGLRVNINLESKANFLSHRGPCDNKKDNLSDRECIKRNDFLDTWLVPRKRPK